MGIYDAYNAPNVASPHAERSRVPEHSSLATASYQIARGCVRFYLIAVGCSLLAYLLIPANPLVTSGLPRALIAGVSTSLVAHAIGLGLGLVGLLQPAQSRNRAVWGILLNGLFPCFLAAAALLATLPLLGIH